jgi:hypothetical protein
MAAGLSARGGLARAAGAHTLEILSKKEITPILGVGTGF